jgi:hypothetical protein
MMFFNHIHRNGISDPVKKASQIVLDAIRKDPTLGSASVLSRFLANSKTSVPVEEVCELAQRDDETLAAVAIAVRSTRPFHFLLVHSAHSKRIDLSFL